MGIAFSKYENDSLPAGTYTSTFTLAAGSNRMILCIPLEQDSVNSREIYKVMFDGKVMAPIGGSNASNFEQGTQLFYLAESVAFSDAGAGGSVSYTVSSGPANQSVVFIQFNNVDSTYPIEQNSYSSASSTGSGSVTYLDNNIHTHTSNAMIVAINRINTTAGATFTGGTGFTMIVDEVSSYQTTEQLGVAYKNVVTPTLVTECRVTSPTASTAIATWSVVLKDVSSSYLALAKTQSQKNIESSKRRYRA